MSLKLVQGPAELPVSLTEVKAHLRVEHTDHDDILDLYIEAETAYCESFTGRRLVTQTWDYYLDAFPAECEPQVIELPIPRVLEITGVFYLDSNGDEQTLDAANYTTDIYAEPARLGRSATGTWPTTSEDLNAVRIRLVVGDEDTTVSPAAVSVRADLKLALLLRIQADYDGTAAAEGLRNAAEIYMRRHRVDLSLA